jgi:hypothetical protein
MTKKGAARQASNLNGRGEQYVFCVPCVQEKSGIVIFLHFLRVGRCFSSVKKINKILDKEEGFSYIFTTQNILSPVLSTEGGEAHT